MMHEMGDLEAKPFMLKLPMNVIFGGQLSLSREPSQEECKSCKPHNSELFTISEAA